MLLLCAWGEPPDPPTFAVRNLDNGQAAVIVSNPTDKPIKLSLPANAVLSHPQLQDQMLLQPARQLSIAAHGQSQFRSTTMCVGHRKEVNEGQGYQLNLMPHHQAERAQLMLEVCRRLQAQGDLPPLPMLAGNQITVVAQWAYWCESGQASKADLSALVHSQIKYEPKDEPEVEKAVDNAWEAIDLTRKQAPK